MRAGTFILRLGRSAVSSITIIGAIIVMLAIAAVGGYVVLSSSTKASSSTIGSTTSSTNTSAQAASTALTAVGAKVNQFNTAFNNGDVEALIALYTPTAVVAWTGDSESIGGIFTLQGSSSKGMDGIFNNTDELQIAYGTIFGFTKTFSMTISNMTSRLVNPSTINATFNIFLNGTSSVVKVTYGPLGHVNATVIAQQEWVNQGGNWKIQKENWDYTSSYSQEQQFIDSVGINNK